MLKALCAAVVGVLLLSACAPLRPIPETERRQPAGFPEQTYLDAARAGRTVLRVDPAESILVVRVYRAGTLARLGHDHVVASHDMQGYALPDTGRADLHVDVARFVVDEPKLRAEAHFDTTPSAEDIAGTRHNMLTTVLDANRYPFVTVSVSGVAGAAAERQARVAISLHGVMRVMQAPLQVENTADGVSVSGRLSLRQTDFGITPLSVLGGAIQVKDEIDLSFRVRARRMK